MTQTYIITFYSHFAAIRFKAGLNQPGFACVLMPVPRYLSSSCGTCAKVEVKDVPDSGCNSSSADRNSSPADSNASPVDSSGIPAQDTIFPDSTVPENISPLPFPVSHIEEIEQIVKMTGESEYVCIYSSF